MRISRCAIPGAGLVPSLLNVTPGTSAPAPAVAAQIVGEITRAAGLALTIDTDNGETQQISSTDIESLERSGTRTHLLSMPW